MRLLLLFLLAGKSLSTPNSPASCYGCVHACSEGTRAPPGTGAGFEVTRLDPGLLPWVPVAVAPN